MLASAAWEEAHGLARHRARHVRV